MTDRTVPPADLDKEYLIEWLKCSMSAEYFIDTYVRIYDAAQGDWIPFKLWAAQVEALKVLDENQYTIILKARQLGLTWLFLAYALWLSLFRAAATILLFSRRDDDAVYLLGSERFRGMYERLPTWCKAQAIIKDNDHQLGLSNGSNIRSFPTTAGDSYTASFVLVDEADLVPNLNQLLRAVKPTMDTGGKMALISRADKDTPKSEFKRIYEGAKRGASIWKRIFIPWFARPERTRQWYEDQKADIQERTGALDDLYEQYPETDEQALAPRSISKRIKSEWLLRILDERLPLLEGIPALPGLSVYKIPYPEGKYVGGADPAEGNPTSNDSAFTILDALSGDEVCKLNGQFETDTFASYIKLMSGFYNGAPFLIERNNHGHAVISWMKNFAREVKLLRGLDQKVGWNTLNVSKSQLWADLATAVRDQETKIRSYETYRQLVLIDGSTLEGPPGELDDLAMSYGLAWQGVRSAGKNDFHKLSVRGLYPSQSKAGTYVDQGVPGIDTQIASTTDRKGGSEWVSKRRYKITELSSR